MPVMVSVHLAHGSNLKIIKKLWFWGLTGIFLLLISVLLLNNNILMPVHMMPGDLITPYGIGPFTLKDVFLLGLPHLDSLPQGIWQLITVMSVLGCLLAGHGLVMILTRVFRGGFPGIREALASHWQEIFLLSLIAGYLSPILLTDYFDRYLLFPIPFIIALMTVNNKRIGVQGPLLKLVPVVLILVYGVFSVALVHDYFSWNRVRSDAINWIKKEYMVDHSSIDGGVEFNGFYGYDPKHRTSQSKSWWWVKEDYYLISFGQVQGYAIENRFSTDPIVPAGPREILVLRRLE